MPSKLYPSALDGFCLSCFSTSFRASSVCPSRSNDSASAKGDWVTEECDGMRRPDSVCWAAFPLDENKINPNARMAGTPGRRYAARADACGDKVSKGIQSPPLPLNVALPVPAEPSYVAVAGAIVSAVCL